MNSIPANSQPEFASARNEAPVVYASKEYGDIALPPNAGNEYGLIPSVKEYGDIALPPNAGNEYGVDNPEFHLARFKAPEAIYGAAPPPQMSSQYAKAPVPALIASTYTEIPPPAVDQIYGCLLYTSPSPRDRG